MATTVHVPDALLERVDARARALGVSRNRVIVAALEESLETKGAWPPELVQMLAAPLSARAGGGLEESLAVVRRARVNRRKAPQL